MSESRRNQGGLEWMLNEASLSRALEHLKATPNTDLFACLINKQIQRYVCYCPDPEVEAINAFSLNWGNLNFYAFFPFSVIPKMLNKIRKKKAEGIAVLPDSPTESWYANAHKLMKQKPVYLKRSKTLLTLTFHLSEIHPIRRKLNLMVCHLSGKA